MQISELLLEKLLVVRKRITFNIRLKKLTELLCLVSGVAFCYMLLSRFAYAGPPLVVLAWTSAPCLFVIFIISLFRSATLLQAAIAVDRKYGLSERVSTALALVDFSDSPERPLVKAVLEDANRSEPLISPVHTEPLHFPLTGWFSSVIVLLTLLLAVVPPMYAREHAKEAEKKSVYVSISLDFSQAAEEIGRSSSLRAGSKEIAKSLLKAASAARRGASSREMEQIADKVATARRKLDEQRDLIRHLKESRLLADFSQVLKMGIPEYSRESAKRAGMRLRANPGSSLGLDTARLINRLLKDLKNDTVLRQNLAEAAAALEAQDISSFENALARVGDQFKSDLDEQSVSLAEAVIKAAGIKLKTAGEPGIIVGSRGSGLTSIGAESLSYGPSRVAPEAPIQDVAVNELDIPERFRPVVQKYFANRSK